MARLAFLGCYEIPQTRRLSDARLADIGRRLVEQAIAIDDIWAELDYDERDELLALARAHAQAEAERHTAQYFGPPQKRARKLLRMLLTDEQRRDLRASYGFKVTGSLGGIYRLYPWTGAISRVERRPSGRWQEIERYCWHEEDPDLHLPPADRAIAQVLILRADEARFLAEANVRAPYRRGRYEWPVPR